MIIAAIETEGDLRALGVSVSGDTGYQEEAGADAGPCEKIGAILQ